MIRRTQLYINENRVGLRRKGSGRPITVDELDEQFLLNCIESKTTAHGRRHDQVMYTGHRVKKKDFLKLVNFNRLQRGLKTIKSATTVYNRGRPQNKRSSQSKRHLGLGLFCTKNPPKMENNENEITHYQRAYKKNVVNFFYNPKDEGLSHVIELSMDDKAYLCPDTNTGMEGARNIKLFQQSDENKVRKLPKYEFPTAMVNITPGTYRIMSKKISTIDENDEIEVVEDACYVFVRPKYFVGSSGSVWASEFMRLRHEVPHKFEIYSEIPCLVSTESRSIYFIVKDSLSYIDSTEKEDIMNIKYDKAHKFKGYEIMRCSIVLKSIWQVFDKYETAKLKMTQKDLDDFQVLKP